MRGLGSVMHYLDQAATSSPKPDVVIDAVCEHLRTRNANPGRSGHRLGAEAARSVFATRTSLACLFGATDPRQIIFTPNATAAINLALRGHLVRRDHVVITSYEHNAVMRPLRALREELELDVTIVPADAAGVLDPQAFADAMTGRTRLVIVNHASNVTGTIAPLGEIRAAIGDATLLVDGAQTAGVLPIDLERERIDLFAFTGHKGLLGPQGTGGLYIRAGLEIRPLVYGGTGSASASDVQPFELPDRYEGGTLNAPGLAGLRAGISHLNAIGLEEVRRHELALRRRLWDGLVSQPGVTLYGPSKETPALPVVAVNVVNMPPSELAYRLDREFGIMTRSGLHCSPQAHRTIGTFPEGCVRISAGIMNQDADIEAVIEAVSSLAKDTASPDP